MAEENTSNEQNKSQDKIPDTNSSNKSYDYNIKPAEQKQSSYNSKETDPKEGFENTKTRKWQPGDWINLSLAIFTAGLFAITTLSTIITKRAIDKSDSTNKEYLDRMKQFAEASDTSAKAAIRADSISNEILKLSEKSFENNKEETKKIYQFDSANLSKQQNSINESEREFELENRPYLQIDSMKLSTFKVGKNVAVSFSIINVGKFPAKLLDAKYYIDYGAKKTENEIDTAIYQSDLSTNDLVSNQTPLPLTFILYKKVLTQEEYDKILDVERLYYNEKYVYLAGKIKYCNFLNSKEVYYYNFIYELGGISMTNPIRNKDVRLK
jgi:hypothetical protein